MTSLLFLPLVYIVFIPPNENEKVGVAEPVSDYAAMGSGGLFAPYLLNRLHDDEHPTTKLDMDAAIREAVYVIEEVTKVDLWCGGPTQLFCIRKGNEGDGYILERKKPQEIRRIVSDLASKDSDVKQKQRQILIGTPSAAKKGSSGRFTQRPVSKRFCSILETETVGFGKSAHNSSTLHTWSLSPGGPDPRWASATCLEKVKLPAERVLHIDHLFARMQRLNTYEAKTNAMTRIGSNLSQVLPPPFSCE